MRRLLVGLALVLALVLLAGLTCQILEEKDAPTAPPDRPRDEPTRQPPPTRVPRVETPREKSVEARQAEPGLPATPAASGRLECTVRVPDRGPLGKSPRDGEATLAVSFPTGEVIATQTCADGRTAVFQRLPLGVPLVVRVSMPGCLSGLCCDVVLPTDRPVKKNIELVASPVLAIEVVSMPGEKRVNGARVSLLRGDDVVAEGVTAGGEVRLWSPTVGPLRARVEAPGFAAPADSVIDVWPGEDEVKHRLAVLVAGSVEVAVVGPSGEPRSDVAVWLVGDRNDPRQARTDPNGIAVFTGVPFGLALTAIARSSDGTVAQASVVTAAGPPLRVPLALGAPAPLVGVVTDQGGAALHGARVEVRVLPFDELFVATTDDTGAFETPPLPCGLASVTVSAAGFLEWRSAQTVRIEPRVGGRVTARLVRAPVGALVVAVRDEAGAPVAGATVSILPGNRASTTAADGTCRFDDLPAESEQSVVARKRGTRVRRNLDASAPYVRIPADTAASLEIVLVPRRIESDEPGDASVTGVVLDPSNAPVVAARVEVASVAAFTGADGRFRLDGLRAPKSGEAMELRVTPGPTGLLGPFRCFVELDDGRETDFGTVRLRRRPYARIALPDAPPGRPRLRARGVVVAWLAYDHADVLLGSRRERFTPVAVVSYDGAWLHLPPVDDWKAQGRGEVFVAYPTPHGLVTGSAAWTLAPDVEAALRPAWVSRSGQVRIGASKGRQFESAIFTQVACAALYDPKSIHVPTGDEQPPIDPFASLTSLRTFVADRADVNVDDVAPGRWSVVVARRGGRDADRTPITGTVNVPEESTVKFER